MANITDIYTLTEGESDVKYRATYTLPPCKALICFVMQSHGNMHTWKYPETLDGIRESTSRKGHLYYDDCVNGHNIIVHASPRD